MVAGGNGVSLSDLDWSYRFFYIVGCVYWDMDKNVLVSLGDSRMKEIAEVLGSASCVRILELLGEEDLTISDISERLDMKINTADYNVKKLVGVGLIEGTGHWWSVKGRKMVVYRVSDKRIVISPKKSNAKKFLWVLGLTGVIGIWLRSLFGESSNLAVKGVGDAMLMQDAVFEAAPEMEALAVNTGVNNTVVQAAGDIGFWAGLAGWEWFLIGAWSAIVLFFIFSLISERKTRSFS